MRTPHGSGAHHHYRAARAPEDAHTLVQKLRRYWEWGGLLPKDAAKHKVDLVRSRPDGIEYVDHGKRLWRGFYPPAGREGLVPVAFVFADTTQAKVANTVAVLEEAGAATGRRAGTTPPTRTRSPHGTTARRCPSSSPPWSSSRSTVLPRRAVRRCGGGWDGPESRR
ncbi:hypothetical protein [Streptomyces sp. NPDC040750]|uniref:hypothetical protein n=1 Tax=Streptomyces sp. NPDC040750 TaxID=3154491 RepID=UPI0033CA5DDF